MKALRILLVAAMAMMMVSGAFAEVEVSLGGEAEYSLEFATEEVAPAEGDSTDSTAMTLGDGGKVKLEVSASKELDNGATVAVEARYDAKYDEVGQDYIRVKYMNGPLTVQMLKADRPGFMEQGVDKYVPQDPVYNCEWTAERDVSFQYAGEGMTFTTTLNVGNTTEDATLVTVETTTTTTVDETGNTVETTVETTTEEDVEVDMNSIAVRPAIEVAMGPATLKAAAEFLTDIPQDTDADGPTTTKFGGGAGIEAGLGAITVGTSAAYGVEGGTTVNDSDKDEKTYMSVYAFAKMGLGAATLGVGGGYNITTDEAQDEDQTGYQVNVGFEQGDIIVPGLKVEAGAGYSFIEGHDKSETTKTGGKIKLKYSF